MSDDATVNRVTISGGINRGAPKDITGAKNQSIIFLLFPDIFRIKPLSVEQKKLCGKLSAARRIKPQFYCGLIRHNNRQA
ncbi:hypothetical protein [Pantoea sp. B65]|uniref:hypothetical protein n=1 Tax=Pantoea sp. B65 TaxID=2813359 RepID=UPI0039B6704C